MRVMTVLSWHAITMKVVGGIAIFTIRFFCVLWHLVMWLDQNLILSMYLDNNFILQLFAIQLNIITVAST